MILTSSSRNSPNSYRLAVFICHLFIDGQFRLGHVLYDPKAFDGLLLNTIDSICPIQIPWQTNDIIRPSRLSSHVNDRTDHILQLIFFNPKYLAEQIDQYNEYFTFYNIFVFSAPSDEISEEWLSVIANRKLILKSSLLVLDYNSGNDSVSWFSANGHDSSKVKWLEHDQVEAGITEETNANIFDQTFEQLERTRSIVITAPVWFRQTEEHTHFESILPYFGYIYIANYFSAAFNYSYINITCYVMNNSTVAPQYFTLEHKGSKYKNELSLQYETVIQRNL